MTGRLRIRLGLGAATLALGLAGLAGCAAPAAAPAAAPMVEPASPTASASPSASVKGGPAPIPSTKPVKVTSVTIKAIDVRATQLERLPLLADGSLASPKNPDKAGWYGDGTLPGEVGPAVIAGHVDSTTGPAVFFDLARLERGDRVRVGLSDGDSTTFAVDRVLTTAKKGFPTDEVFGPTPDAQLRLITCGGPYEKSIGYLDNTVVFATAVS